MRTSEVGLIPPTIRAGFIEANSYNVNIDTVKGVAVPVGLVRPEGAGLLECRIGIAGTVASRYRWDGVDPTAAVGIPLPAPTAFVPLSFTLVGESLINAFRIIGTAAGNLMSVTYAWRDTR